MNILLLLFTSYFLLISLIAFPINPWKTYSPSSFNPSTHSLLPTIVDTSTSDIILYTQALSSSGLQYIVYCTNASASTPVQLSSVNFTLSGVISNVKIILMNTQIVVAFYSGSSPFVTRFTKLTLNKVTKQSTAKRVSGIYIQPYSYLIFHKSD